MIICINQVFRSTKKVRIDLGDCSICQYDPENNPKCPKYCPANFTTIELLPEKKVSKDSFTT